MIQIYDQTERIENEIEKLTIFIDGSGNFI